MSKSLTRVRSQFSPLADIRLRLLVEGTVKLIPLVGETDEEELDLKLVVRAELAVLAATFIVAAMEGGRKSKRSYSSSLRFEDAR